MKTMSLLIGVAFAAITAQAQSLLTTPPEPPAQTAARESIIALQGIRSSNLAMLRDAVARTFPAAVDKQEVITLWGTIAAAIFALFDGHIAYLRSVLVASGDTAGIAELDAIIAPVPAAALREVHEDGTVTLNIPPEE